ncbi:hypothetical protein RIF29_31546 [Crotalaria pallida]|uniref:B box-type domain-containing protein n=1 Tax=Crotalaria pallida TaxID=3830 RepID=A0AAN9EHR9_CROPI
MCKGAKEKKSGGGEVDSCGATRGSSGSAFCELCGLKASLYCQADDAYLCTKCDKLVHKANFLALRHIRCFLCNTCQNLTRRYLIGASLEVVLPETINLAEENLPNNNSGHRNCSRTQNSYYKFL